TVSAYKKGFQFQQRIWSDFIQRFPNSEKVGDAYFNIARAAFGPDGTYARPDAILAIQSHVPLYLRDDIIYLAMVRAVQDHESSAVPALRTLFAKYPNSDMVLRFLADIAAWDADHGVHIDSASPIKLLAQSPPCQSVASLYDDVPGLRQLVYAH